MASGRFTYDPSNLSITAIEYTVAESGDPWFQAAYPTVLEEQRDEDIFFSENGERTNNEDGTNAAGKEPRDYDTGIAWNEDRFDAYKAAMLAQNKKLVPSIAKEVVPATNEITYESVGEENIAN